MKLVGSNQQGYQLIGHLVDFVVDEDVIELVRGGHFGARGLESAGHGLGGFGATPGQARHQFVPAGRGEEDADRLGQPGDDVACAHQIHLDQDGQAGVEGVGGPGRKFFAVTPAGLIELQSRTTSWLTFTERATGLMTSRSATA